MAQWRSTEESSKKVVSGIIPGDEKYITVKLRQGLSSGEFSGNDSLRARRGSRWRHRPRPSERRHGSLAPYVARSHAKAAIPGLAPPTASRRNPAGIAPPWRKRRRPLALVDRSRREARGGDARPRLSRQCRRMTGENQRRPIGKTEISVKSARAPLLAGSATSAKMPPRSALAEPDGRSVKLDARGPLAACAPGDAIARQQASRGHRIVLCDSIPIEKPHRRLAALSASNRQPLASCPASSSSEAS